MGGIHESTFPGECRHGMILKILMPLFYLYSRTCTMPPKKLVYQFKVRLKWSKPPIWRRIQVPSTYTFWDLHVAIQDAMGWFGFHLHEFRVIAEAVEILLLGVPKGRPDDVFGGHVTLPDWKHTISEYEDILPKAFITYINDFEGYWEHLIDFEKVISAEVGVTYPRCINGKRACPPEDCGGAWGYADLLEALADPMHEDHDELKEWVEAQTGGPFDPEHFDPAKVVFSDPKQRYKESFE